MSNMIVTVDIDWACEAAIEETLDFLDCNNIAATIFTTHNSRVLENNMNKIEVGLHPYFGKNSSHGNEISEVVKYVMDLPHNIPAYRCHRFATCNSSQQAMAEVGMVISSNTCTDLEIIAPFKNRFGNLEVPIFLEDGGYLWRKHQLKITSSLQSKILQSFPKVIIIHPMHFVLNTPNFNYMYEIKRSLQREEWQNLPQETIKKLRWNKHGIRDFLIELIQLTSKTSFLSSLISRNHLVQ